MTTMSCMYCKHKHQILVQSEFSLTEIHTIVRYFNIVIDLDTASRSIICDYNVIYCEHKPFDDQILV